MSVNYAKQAFKAMHPCELLGQQLQVHEALEVLLTMLDLKPITQSALEPYIDESHRENLQKVIQTLLTQGLLEESAEGLSVTDAGLEFLAHHKPAVE